MQCPAHKSSGCTGWVFRMEILVFCLSSKPMFRFHSQAAFADLSRGSSPPTYRDLGDMDSAAGPSGIPEAPPSREPRASYNHSDCCDLLVFVSDTSTQKNRESHRYSRDLQLICAANRAWPGMRKLNHLQEKGGLAVWGEESEAMARWG